MGTLIAIIGIGLMVQQVIGAMEVIGFIVFCVGAVMALLGK